MSKFMNPFTDYAFKKLFGEDDAKIYLIDFLNSILGNNIPFITDIQHKRTELLGRHNTDRNSIFDLYCTTEYGEKIIIEMQKIEQTYFKDRSLFYVSSAIQEQNRKGKVSGLEWDFKLSPVYCVAILNFSFDDKHPDKYLHIGKLLDIETHEELMDRINFAFIEMPKFKKTLNNCETKQDKWLYTLYNLERLQDVPSELEDDVFLEFFHKAEISALKGEERGNYEDSLKYFRDLHIIEIQNHQKGMQKGMQQGIQQGIEQGEINKALEIAVNMKRKGLDINTIAEITNLSVDEINKL